MKKLLPFLLTLGVFPQLFAQVCTPDPAYKDSTGVFPLPFHATLNPNGGIRACAYIGTPFSYTFTVGVGDSITVPFGGTQIKLPLDSVVVVSVSGLPAGLSYACDKPGCKFPKKTSGCAAIFGTPTAANAPGDYLLLIKGRAHFPVFPFQFMVDFPGQFFPGEYRLKLLANASEPCNLSDDVEIVVSEHGFLLQPNPASDFTRIVVSDVAAGVYQLIVTDVAGRVVHRRAVELFGADSVLTLDTDHLQTGFYFVHFGKESFRMMTQKLMILR